MQTTPLKPKRGRESYFNSKAHPQLFSSQALSNDAQLQSLNLQKKLPATQLATWKRARDFSAVFSGLLSKLFEFVIAECQQQSLNFLIYLNNN